ncbi:MAG: hypothetical protein M0Z89_11600, partial [Nitrospiraceae bacterium]|nr:hypothetical protein [Nitrospiraceae bacterium]
IPDLMFPVPMLPDCLLSFMNMRFRLPSLELVSTAPAEMALDLSPANGKIVVIFRQGPNAMQMLRQQYKSVYSKRVLLFDRSKGVSQQRNV